MPRKLSTKKRKAESSSSPTPPVRMKLSLSTSLDVNHRLTRNFFSQPTVDLAKKLLGCLIVHNISNDQTVACKIVETEGYPGGCDKASHSAGGRRTERTAAMFMQPGTIYVYIIYGKLHCCNISALEDGGAVLIRAVEPVYGLETMRNLRAAQGVKLTNGPAKFCSAMNITKNCDQLDSVTHKNFYLLASSDDINEGMIVTSKRVGIDGYGEEAANQPWRFYLLNNKYVSIRDKQQEKLAAKS